MPFRLLLVATLASLSSHAIAQAPPLALPTAKQIRFADWEVGAFIHYGLNVYIDQEHGDGRQSPELFNPTALDAEQWVLTAKAMGARYACLTARHEGGFCLWPSKTTDYTIANSPYKNGKGDIVRDFVNACRKHGIEPCLYHTAGHDSHTGLARRKGEIAWGEQREKAIEEAFKDKDVMEQYKEVQLEQMRELLTNYGPISFMWSDHWDATDPDGVWRAVTKLVAELQPEMVFMGPETWVPGNETGHVVYPMWNAVDTVDGTEHSRPAATKGDVTVKNDYGLLESAVRRGSPSGKYWRVRECTTNSGFHYGGWFWKPDSIRKTYPRKHWEHVDLYYRTVGLGANTIINLPPDDRGLIPDDFAAAAKALGDDIRERFSNPIASLDEVTAGDTVELVWEVPTEINTVVTMENIATGQKIAKYTLEAYVDGEWQALESRNKLIGWKPYNTNPGYETIGHKKIDRVAPVTTNQIRFRCLEAVAQPVEIRSLTAFRCDPIEREFAASYPSLSGVDTITESAHAGVRRDNNYRGNRIAIHGKEFDQGLLMHPAAISKKGHAEWDLRQVPKAKGLTAHIGIDDGTKGAGSSAFLVEVYEGKKWKTLYRSPVLKGNDPGVDVRVEFPPAATHLRLTTTNGGDNSSSDHAMWADAKFFE